MPSRIRVSTPGRICLFGEHQDYLGLPIIAAAISLRVRMQGVARRDKQCRIALPDIHHEVKFDFNDRQQYKLQRDYFRSGYNVLHDRGVRWAHGWDCEVRGKIPINSGTSSSSALLVTWIKFLLAAADHPDQHNAERISRLAHRAEVIEFDEPGGMMDQFSTCFGQVIYLDFDQNKIEQLQPPLGTFVLGDSLQPKDTMGILANVKQAALEATQLMKAHVPHFDLRHTAYEEASDALAKLPSRHAEVLAANLIDRDLLRKARALLKNTPLDHQRFGQLLSAHHEQLSNKKRISTSKIDRMLEAAMQAGAYGGKINGSGGGGCMFAYAPEHPEAVAEAIRSAGGMPYIVTVDEGARLEEFRE